MIYINIDLYNLYMNEFKHDMYIVFFFFFIYLNLDLEHHVHFSGASGPGKDNKIVIQPQRHGQIDVHLGFLQLHHRLHFFCTHIKKLNI